MDIIVEYFQQFGLEDYVIFTILGILGFIWIRSVLWVTKDISNRSDSLLKQIICIVITFVLTPIVGLPIYFLLRPEICFRRKK